MNDLQEEDRRNDYAQSHENTGNENSLEYSIDNKIRNTTAHALRVERAAARRHLCYMLTATALANVGDGGNRSLEVNTSEQCRQRDETFKPGMEGKPQAGAQLKEKESEAEPPTLINIHSCQSI